MATPDGRTVQPDDAVPASAWIRLAVKILLAVLLLLMFGVSGGPIPLYQGF